MTRAILTIDDGASPNTFRYMEYLSEKNIHPILFFWGKRLESAYEQGIKALQMGAVVGNHSFSHPHFSDLSYEQCLEEIQKQEELLSRLYRDTEVERTYKLFRFPYGDKGGQNAPKLQQYLKDQGFHRLKDDDITYPWYREKLLHRDIDVFWTFDLQEYRLSHEEGFTFQDVLRHMADPNPVLGGSLHDSGTLQIILIHDHPETEEKRPGYFPELIQRLIDMGVQFEIPEFRGSKERRYI